jgi:hypothetical protein
MRALQRLSLALLVLWALTATARPCAAQFAPTRFMWQGKTACDRFGRVQGHYFYMVLDNGDQWLFALPRGFLDLPVAVQLDYLDARFGLGLDRPLVGTVLQSIHDARRLR